MKALGISFFGYNTAKVLLKKKGDEMALCQEHPLKAEEKPLKALAVDFLDTKVRFYPLPKTSRQNQKKLLLSRLASDPMIDLSLLNISFKEVPLGLEVHFIEKKRLEAFKKDFDFITSPQQALFRFLKDFKALFEPALVIVEQKGVHVCLHYTPTRWGGFGIWDESCQSLSEIQKFWGLERIFVLGSLENFKDALNLEKVESLPLEALSIGASIEALDPKGICFHSPLESKEFRQKLLSISKNLFFALSLAVVSVCVLVRFDTEQKIKEIKQEILAYEQTEDFSNIHTKSPKKVSLLLKDLHGSLEPFGLELVEFDLKQELTEKKPFIEIYFRVEGDSQQMEKYAQSIRKISGSILSKMQPLPEGKKGDFVLKIPL
jgi:hypothetical protein